MKIDLLYVNYVVQQNLKTCARIARQKEELEALSKKNVVEVSAEFKGRFRYGIFIGTEAVLHKFKGARVIFLEFDQELLASRFQLLSKQLL